MTVIIFLNIHLLLGSLANTNSDGVLNSPGPELLIADTRNSYSIPSTTSLTANSLAMLEKYKQDHTYAVYSMIRYSFSIVNNCWKTEILMITSDHLIGRVDLAPQVAALLAFLKVVSQNTGSSSVGRRRPRESDAVSEGTDNLWCWWRSRISCIHKRQYLLSHNCTGFFDFCWWYKLASLLAWLLKVKWASKSCFITVCKMCCGGVQAAPEEVKLSWMMQHA